MQRSKTHFEQIPVAAVKKIAEEVHDDDGNVSAVTTIPPRKLMPHRVPSLGKNESVSNNANPETKQLLDLR